jgi:hypothetical protein
MYVNALARLALPNAVDAIVTGTGCAGPAGAVTTTLDAVCMMIAAGAVPKNTVEMSLPEPNAAPLTVTR